MKKWSASLFFILALCQTEAASSTFPVTAQSIPGGLLLRFEPDRELRRSLDHFLVLRTTENIEGIPTRETISHDVSTDTAARLEYYHDWYKDYFYSSDLRRTFHYKIAAYGQNSKILAVSEPEWTSWTVKEIPTPGIMIVPSAYRKVPIYDTPTGETGKLLPMNIDITTIYFIGRIYSYNRLEELTNQRSVLFTRLGVWFLQLDGKMILEKESRFFPQLAAGAEGAYLLRDSKAPGIQNPTFAFNFQKENSRSFTGIFAVASKQIGRLQATAGWISGSSPAKLIYLTEFLPSAQQPSQGIFGGISFQVSRRFNFQAEAVRALGTTEKPMLLNIKMGSAAHTNFDVGYLRYNRGFEILGHFSFRYTLYPFRSKKK
ncbi:MAG: hypothetical protein HY747_00435 [Elusimicrobia bacterium]|nr:hypothetical protein [Elusimicrobiota bacterium]